MNPSRFLAARLVAVLAMLAALAPATLAQPPHDLVLRGGQIVDGTGNPWFTGDVAIRGDTIVAVERQVLGPANQELDVSGLIVAPGFIDIHSHSDWLLLEDGRAESKIRQGVTTEILGESTSPGPFQGRLAPRPVSAGNQSVRIASLAEYFDTVDRAGVSVNVASYVGLGNVWQCVMGHGFERPSQSDLDRMKALVDEAMDQGALGLSSMLMMPPGSLATTDDLVQLCEVVRRHGGIFSSHIRDEGQGVFDSVHQVIEVARRARLPLDIIHLKIADQVYWGRMNEVVGLIESARQDGVDVQANVYPYTRGNNNLSSIIPPWAHEGGTQAMLDRLKDPNQRARLQRDITQGLPGWYNHYTAVGGDWSRMLVSDDNRYKGLTMDQVFARRGAAKDASAERLLDMLFDLLIEENGSVGTVYAHHTESDMNLALAQPWCSVGSDGSAYAVDGLLRRGNPHPRNFGTFPRVLGRYVREQKLLTLEDAVRKMTSLNAAKVGLRDRGRIAPGMFADLTVLDAGTILDQSTFTDPFHYNTGIVYVIVNGQVVLDHDRHTGAKPGRALRHESARLLVPEFLGEIGAGEGPAWHPDGFLCFSGGGRIGKRTDDGRVEAFREPSGGSNGLLFDRLGRLVVCEAANRRVTRTELGGTITMLAERFDGHLFNTPNDLAIDSKGRIFFSDPRYGNRDSMEMRDTEGRLVEGVYRIDAPGRVARVIAHEVDRPNGVLVSPDDRHLYVAGNNNNTRGGERMLIRFDLTPDGDIVPASRRVIYDWEDGRGPDGMKMDSEGRLYVAAGLTRAQPPFEKAMPHLGGIYIFEAGERLAEFVPIPRDEVTNCAFGGRDLRTLYVTAGGTLWSFRIRSPGRVAYASEPGLGP